MVACHLRPHITLVLDSSTGKPADGVAVTLQELTTAKYDGGPDIFDPLGRGYVATAPTCNLVLIAIQPDEL